MRLLFAWSKWHNERNTGLVLMENVPQLPLRLVEDLFGENYYVYPMVVDPAPVMGTPASGQVFQKAFFFHFSRPFHQANRSHTSHHIFQVLQDFLVFPLT